MVNGSVHGFRFGEIAPHHPIPPSVIPNSFRDPFLRTPGALDSPRRTAAGHPRLPRGERGRRTDSVGRAEKWIPKRVRDDEGWGGARRTRAASSGAGAQREMGPALRLTPLSPACGPHRSGKLNAWRFNAVSVPAPKSQAEIGLSSPGARAGAGSVETESDPKTFLCHQAVPRPVSQPLPQTVPRYP
jgi:hypothetical protein